MWTFYIIETIRRIEHYQQKDVLRFQTFPWDNELIRATNESDKNGCSNNLSLTVYISYHEYA